MSKERVEALLAGETPDRLPWVPELNEGFVRKLTGQPPGSGPDYRHLEREAAGRIGADFLHRVKNVRVVRHRVEERRDPETGVTLFRTPAGELRQQKLWDARSGTSYTHEHIVKGPESFEAYLAMLEDETYEPDYARAEGEIADSDLATIDAPASPLMHLMLWDMDVEPTLMAMMTETGAMVELMSAMHERNQAYYRVASAGPGAIVRPMEDTSSQLTGPRMYRDHAVAHLNDYARIVHDAGKRFIVHMCGHLGGAMPAILAEIDLDGVEAITPPPLGDADLAVLRETLGDAWLLGGVDPSLYANATVEQMTAHVAATLEVMRGDRKFMLGHEEIPVAARLENVQAVAKLVERTAEGFYT